LSFRGLFVGVDRYEALDISWLSCAGRDARAVHAIFEDTLGAGGALLLDEAATLATIRDQLTELERADADDVVVVFYSGHGAPTHHLVAYDTTVDDIGGTGLSLDELTQRFSRIPARRLLCVLDCCFSGGMGAKVLTRDITPRDMRSTESLLARMAGDGRVMLTASGATEEAWEHAALGHGYLTYHLIEALTGAAQPEVTDRVSLLRVLEFVTSSVVSSARSGGASQHPTIRGTFEGEVVWPVFQRGAAYLRAFPDWNANRATDDIRSLEALGFPSALVDAWAGAIPTLNPLQLAAINDHGVLDGKNLLVSAPTSSGKTMIGELAAVRAALDRRRAVFLLPMRALVNDKYAAFTATYGAFGIRTIRATGEIEDDIPELIRARYDICLMTNEKFAAMALGMPHLLDQVSVVVLDEAQMIADPDRGVVLEFLLTMLKVRAQTAPVPQVILLSAVIGAANSLDAWLEAGLLVTHVRPVPLDEGLIKANGDFRYLDQAGAEVVEPGFIHPSFYRGSAQDWIIPLVQRLVADGEQVIVFRPSKGEARGTASYLAANLGLPPAAGAVDRLPAGDPSGSSIELRRALSGGVAFHISDLDRDEKAAIEEEFRRPGSGLRVIAATTTLAMGVNTPASAVVIAGLDHPRGLVSTPYAVAEYKNMVGRAGRLGFAEKGRSFVIANVPLLEHQYWGRYVLGRPEDIVSRFPISAGDPASLITRILASSENPDSRGLTRSEIVAFVEQSYAAYLEQRDDATWALDGPRFERALGELAGAEMVLADGDGRYTLTPLGRLAGRTGTEVVSVLRLVNALRPLGESSLTPETLITATQITAELDDTRLPLHRKSHAEVGTWAPYLSRNGVAGHVLRSLGVGATEAHTSTMRAKRAVACLLWMSDMSLAAIEATLTRHVPVRTAAGELRGVTSRTLDLLPTAMAVAQILHPDADLGEGEAELIARLQLGIPAGLGPLGRWAGAALARADYLALSQAGLDTFDALEGTTDDDLERVLGDKRRVRAVRTALARRAEEASAPSFALGVGA
jgi:helicase